MPIFRQMESNTLCFEQVARFEDDLIPAVKSSLDYKERQALAVSLIGECAQIRMELLQARLDLTRRKLLNLTIDQERLHDLLVRYKKTAMYIFQTTGNNADVVAKLYTILGLLEHVGMFDNLIGIIGTQSYSAKQEP